jgi:hypothetical protein
MPSQRMRIQWMRA